MNNSFNSQMHFLLDNIMRVLKFFDNDAHADRCRKWGCRGSAHADIFCKFGFTPSWGFFLKMRRHQHTLQFCPHRLLTACSQKRREKRMGKKQVNKIIEGAFNEGHR